MRVHERPPNLYWSPERATLGHERQSRRARRDRFPPDG
jgi:hypothetical protein